MHEGCARVLKDHFTIAPVRSEAEGARVTLEEGFDAASVRLTGNVVGKAPFKGTLSHRGWKATERTPAAAGQGTRRQRAGAGGGGAVSARYAIGIDLGTTHSALSYVDLEASDGENTAHGVLPVPQLTAPGTVEALPLLPSFLYLPHPDELAPGELALPWNTDGETLGRRRDGAQPRRHHADPPGLVGQELAVPPERRPPRRHPADRRAGRSHARLAAGGLHPLPAHLRQAWDSAHPEAPFDQQQVTVTIPASFDPGARELTAEAARNAGYTSATLLEEPQAALYSWIQGSNGAWRKQVKAGDIVLVVDVGGGTSDFSLIAVLERDGKLEPHRVAVGDHILLGGDNMDLALAHLVARKLAANGTQLDAWQMRSLTYGCRGAKEHLLADAECHRPGRSSCRAAARN